MKNFNAIESHGKFIIILQVRFLNGEKLFKKNTFLESKLKKLFFAVTF